MNQINQLEPLKITYSNSGEPADDDDCYAAEFKQLLTGNDNDETRSLYPPMKVFEKYYRLWEQHESIYWNSNEFKAIKDKDMFAKAPKELQEIVLKCAGSLLHGDSAVLEIFANDSIRKMIQAEPVLAFIRSQENRETMHAAVYSKFLDISMDPIKSNYYRSKEYRDSSFHEFREIIQQCVKDFDTTLASSWDQFGVSLYLIMLCENIMFAPLFLIICYIATTNYAPRLCEANRQVMNDEMLHYIFARSLLADTKCLPAHIAETLLNRFMEATMNRVKNIIGDYSSEDGKLSIANISEHMKIVEYKFRLQNGLTIMEEQASNDVYKNIPSSLSLCAALPQLNSSINQMEMISGEYQSYVSMGELSNDDESSVF
jgi:ribonucleotide reductase beta subunit family protein with ferritin-like domain